MEQLPLEISGPAAPDFDNFIPGDNAEALASVRALAAGTLRETVLYLWGDAGSGRSHLLEAARGTNAELVIADDVEKLDAPGEQALFVAINSAREGLGAPVLAAGNAPPARLALREDLRTRLAWGLVYQLRAPSDAQKAEHLKAEAARRGLHLSDEVIRYLLSHLPRDLASLNRVLDSIDRHSLARQRPITVPLVREVVAATQASGG